MARNANIPSFLQAASETASETDRPGVGVGEEPPASVAAEKPKREPKPAGKRAAATKRDRGETVFKGFRIYADQEKPLLDQAYAEKLRTGKSVSVSDVVRRAIDEYLEKHKADRV